MQCSDDLYLSIKDEIEIKEEVEDLNTEGEEWVARRADKRSLSTDPCPEVAPKTKKLRPDRNENHQDKTSHSPEESAQHSILQQLDDSDKEVSDMSDEDDDWPTAYYKPSEIFPDSTLYTETETDDGSQADEVESSSDAVSTSTTQLCDEQQSNSAVSTSTRQASRHRMFYGAFSISGSPPIYTYSGPMVGLFDTMARHLGYCYRLEASPERVYGKPLPNGSWTGLMGMLQRREANVTATLLSVTWLRAQVVDFSEPIDIDEFTALHARPVLTSDMAGFVRPFTYQTWLLLLLSSLTAFAATFFVLQRHQNRTASLGVKQQRRHSPAEWRISLEESSLWTWCGLLAQSVPRQPKGEAVRVIVGLWLLTSSILAIVYRCVLKAMLILPRIHLPFDSLEQLVQTGIPVAIGEGTSIHVEIMRASNTTSLGQLREAVVPVPAKFTKLYNLKTMEGHMAGMRTGTVAKFIVNDDFAMTGVCRAYIMSRGFFGPNSLSIAFPKGSPLKQQFDSIIVQFREFGIIKKVFKDALANSTDCFKPFHATVTSSKTRPLQLEDLFGVFSLIATDILMATLVFLVEVTSGSH